MVYLKTLPLLDGAKTIIVDEGLDSMYGRTLIAGWLNMWNNQGTDRTFEIFSFLDPVYRYSSISELFIANNIKIHDFYTYSIENPNKIDYNTLEHAFGIIDSKSVVIIDCLNSLLLRVGRAKCMLFVDKLSKRVSQLICIYRHYLFRNTIPQISTLGSTYVKLAPFCGLASKHLFTYVAKLTHQKPSGKILEEEEIVHQDIISYELVSQQTGSNNHKAPYKRDKKIESSFRLDVNAYEMQQRDNVILPYLPTKSTGTIVYVPDETDDREEDLDDDLLF